MLKTIKQIADDNGRVERLAIVAIRKLQINPAMTQPHAGRTAKYYDEEAQAKIAAYMALSRSDKMRLYPSGKPRRRPARKAISREQWTYHYIGKRIGATWQGARTLLQLHGCRSIEEVRSSGIQLDDVRAWYAGLEGETAWAKGRTLVALRAEHLGRPRTSAKLWAAQAKIIARYDPSKWATRQQAREFLGKNDTTTYALYKQAGFRFVKEGRVRLYNWEDLKLLKSTLDGPRRGSTLAEILRARLVQEGLEFTAEKTFSDLKLKKPVRFDFCLPAHKVLVEVQGQQHFTEGYQGFATSLSLQEIQRRDTLKREYAMAQGWDLVWVSSLGDVDDAVTHIKTAPSQHDWPPSLVADYGAPALSHYNGDAPTFCWLHRGHFPYHRAGMILKRIHKSYWDSAVGKDKSPHVTWETRKEVFQRLVRNRQKYNPSIDPSGIPTLSMLVAGFNISRISPPASFFAPDLGEELIKAFAEGSCIVDPFSGFSGRALAAHSCGKKYRGFDISAVRVQEAQEAIHHYGMDATVEVLDADQEGFHEWGEATMLTCPPYGDKESWDGQSGHQAEDHWITQSLRHHGCLRYIFVVGTTRAYSQYEVPWQPAKKHAFFGRGLRKVVIISRTERDSLVEQRDV